MPDWMPSWGMTALISIATSLLTLIVSGRYVSPLLEVRNRRFQTQMQAREKLMACMTVILSAGGRLLGVQVPSQATETVRAAIRQERERWRAQVDEATRHLSDNFEQFALAYNGSRVPGLAVRFAGNARMVWISDRNEEDKLRHLQAITGECHVLFFASPWRLVQRVRAHQELERLLNELEASGEASNG